MRSQQFRSGLVAASVGLLFVLSILWGVAWPPGGWIVGPVAAGIAAGAIHAWTHGRLRIWWCVLAVAIGFVALLTVAAIFSSAIDCWACRDGDFTNGEVFVFLAILLVPLSVWTLAAMVLLAAAAEVVINDHWGLFGSNS